MRKKLTTAVSNYEKSGQHDPDKSERDFMGGDLALEYCWLTLDAMNAKRASYLLEDEPVPGPASVAQRECARCSHNTLLAP